MPYPAHPVALPSWIATYPGGIKLLLRAMVHLNPERIFFYAQYEGN